MKGKVKKFTIIAGGLLFVGYLTYSFTLKKNDLITTLQEKPYQAAQCVILAKNLSEDYTGDDKCLLIHHPIFGENMGEINRLIRYFREEFGGKIKEIRPVPIKDVSTEDELEEEAMLEITGADFNKVIEKYPQYDMIITLVPLPFSMNELSAITYFENKKPHQKLGIFNGYIGNLASHIEEGKIDCISLWKPKPILDEQPIPESTQEAFDKKYLIISPENLSSRLKEYPTLFPKKRK